MRKKAFGLVVLGMVGIVPVALVDRAWAETLDDALIAAYSSNPTLLAERARLRATDELVPQAEANWRPTVSVTSATGSNSSVSEEATYLATGVFAAHISQYYNDQTVGLTLTQPLYRGGRTVAQTEQAEASVMAGRASLDNTEQTILLAAGTAYFDVVRAQAVLNVSIEAEHVLLRLRDVTGDRFRAGEVTRTDVEQAESRLAAAHADRRAAEAALRAARAEYVDTVGHAPETLEPPTSYAGLPASFEEAERGGREDNPAVQAAKFNYEAAKAGIDLIAGELLPTVSLTGTALKGYNYSGPATAERIGQATINVTIPLYQQGQEYSRLRAQKHTAGQSLIAIDVARRDAEQQVTQSWENLQAAEDRTMAYEAQVKSARLVLEGVQREAQLGARTVVETLNAEQELFSAETNLAQAKHDAEVFAFQLRSAIGRLTAKSLALAVDIYDPVKHFKEIDGKWIGTSISPDYGNEGK
jgi:outer membrane protein